MKLSLVWIKSLAVSRRFSMLNYSKVKHVLVVGQPTEMVEDKFPHISQDAMVDSDCVFTQFGGFTYVNSVSDIVDPIKFGVGGVKDDEVITNTWLVFIKRGGVIYIGSAIEQNTDDHRALLAVCEIRNDAVIDEALELLQLQVIGPVDQFDFQDRCIEAMQADTKVEFVGADEDNTVCFHAPYRASKTHSIKWCNEPNGETIVELDGAIIRRTALMGSGHLKTEVLGGGILTPSEVVGFIAVRMGLCGVDDLIGYG